MTPEKVYYGLNLVHPLIFERHSEGLVGSTTHMAVEAALDYYALEQRQVTRRWYIVTERSEDTEQVRKVLRAVQKFLRRDTGSDFQFLTPEMFRAARYLDPVAPPPRPMIYVDHRVVSPDRRVTGPHRMVRQVKLDGSRIMLCDRMQRTLLESTADGVNQLLSLTSCPIFDGRRGVLVQGGRIYAM